MSLARNNLLPDLVRQILCAEPPEFGFDSSQELLNLTVCYTASLSVSCDYSSNSVFTVLHVDEMSHY